MLATMSDPESKDPNDGMEPIDPGLDVDSVHAIQTFNAIRGGMKSVEQTGYVPRVRMAHDVDLSFHDPDCDRCDGGVVSHVNVDKPPPEPPPDAKRIERKRYKRMMKKWKPAPPVPVVCNCVVRNGGVVADQNIHIGDDSEKKDDFITHETFKPLKAIK